MLSESSMVQRSLGAVIIGSIFTVIYGGLIGSSMDQYTDRSTYKLAIPESVSQSNIQTYWEEVAVFSDGLRKAFGLKYVRSIKFAHWILQAETYNNDVPAKIIAGVIRTESSFRYSATSSVGAIGPGQVRPS